MTVTGNSNPSRMKKFTLLFFGLFFIGFGIKLFHIHYNAVIMLIGLGGILVTSLVALSRAEERTNGLLHLTLFTCLLLLFLAIKFLPFGSPVLIAASVLTVIVVAAQFKEHSFTRFIPLLACLALAVSFHFMRTDRRYFILNVNWNYEIDEDFLTLDKYSWFLYANGEAEKALQVSDRALEMAQKTSQQDPIDFVRQHNEAIRLRSWEHYRLEHTAH